MADSGPNPYVVDIERATLDNEAFRDTLWTGNRKGPGTGHRSRAESVGCYTPSVSFGSLSASTFVSWRVPGSCSGGA